MKKTALLFGCLSFFLSTNLRAAQIKISASRPGSPGALAAFKPMGATGFSQFDPFVVRVREEGGVDLFRSLSWFMPGEPVIYIQRNPKSTFESPVFLIGGASKESSLFFDRNSPPRTEGKLSRKRLVGLSLEKQLEKSGFTRLAQPGVFAYLNDEDTEVGYAIVENGVDDLERYAGVGQEMSCS